MHCVWDEIFLPLLDNPASDLHQFWSIVVDGIPNYKLIFLDRLTLTSFSVSFVVNQHLTKIVSKSVKEFEYMYAILYISEVANENTARSLNYVCSKVQIQHSFNNVFGWQILQR